MWIVQVMTKMLWYCEWVIWMTHTNIKGLSFAPISVKTPLFIPTVFLQLKIASNESILGLLFFESTFSGSKGYGSTSMSHTVWIILYDWHSWTYVCMLSDFCGINMLCTFRLVVYCFFNCIFKISECSNVKASITCYGSKDFWAGDSTLKF